MLPVLSFICTSARSSSSSLTGRLLPGVWVGARTSGISCLHHWAYGMIWKLSEKKCLKTKPKKSRPTTCKRKLSGIFKSSSCQQQSHHVPHVSCYSLGRTMWPLECCRCWAGSADHPRAALVRHSWTSSSAPVHTAVQEDFTCTPEPIAQSCSLEADACYSQHTELGRRRRRMSLPQRTMLSPAREVHIQPYMTLFCIYGTLFLWQYSHFC